MTAGALVVVLAVALIVGPAAVVALAITLALTLGVLVGLGIGAAHSIGVEELNDWQAEHRDRARQWRERQVATVLAFALMVSQSSLRKGRQMAAAVLRWFVPPATPPKRHVPARPRLHTFMDGLQRELDR